MAFATGSSGNNATMGDINVTPLVDVMLVLLIIFMVTTPMLSYQIGIDLPIPGPEKKPAPPADPIRLRIDSAGALYWDNRPMPASALVASLRVEATRDPQPQLELETSPDADYATLAGVLATAKNAGMGRIGFVDSR